MTLIRRDELRLALVTGLCAGLASLSPLGYGYYMPLAVVAVMASSYGSSYRLGLQRLLGSVLGAAILLACQGLVLPLPLSLAIALALTRLIGGLLGLEVGYKVGGFVVVMGFLVHGSSLTSWLPMRLLWTCLGIFAGLVAMQLFWPSKAIEQRHQACRALLLQMAGDLQQQAQRLEPIRAKTAAIALVHPPGPEQRRAIHRQELGALMALRSTMPAAVMELGPNPERQPLERFWRDLDNSMSVLMGVLDSLRSLSPPLEKVPSLQEVHGAESELLGAVAERLSLWARVLPSADLAWPQESSPLATKLEMLRRSEDQLFKAPIPELGPSRERQIAQRLMLCHQAASAVESMERRWLELKP